MLVVISWFAANEVLAQRVRALLREVVPEQPTVEQRRALSQFEHYRSISASLSKLPSGTRARAWIAFSDDDDLWHPRRLQTFRVAIEQVQAERTVTQVRFPWFAVRAEGAAGGAWKRPTSASEVDVLLKTGGATIYNTDATDMDESEYWASVSRLRLLEAFFAVAPSQLVACPFADLAWERYSHHFSFHADGSPVVEGAEAVTAQWHREQPWLYYYDVPPGGSMQKQCQFFSAAPPTAGELSALATDHVAGGGHASSLAFEPSSADLKAAASVLPRLSARFPRLPPTSEADLSRKLAALRRNLTVTCCQRIWPLRQLVPADQLLAGLLKARIALPISSRPGRRHC